MAFVETGQAFEVVKGDIAAELVRIQNEAEAAEAMRAARAVSMQVLEHFRKAELLAQQGVDAVVPLVIEGNHSTVAILRGVSITLNALINPQFPAGEYPDSLIIPGLDGMHPLELGSGVNYDLPGPGYLQNATIKTHPLGISPDVQLAVIVKPGEPRRLGFATGSAIAPITR